MPRKLLYLCDVAACFFSDDVFDQISIAFSVASTQYPDYDNMILQPHDTSEKHPHKKANRTINLVFVSFAMLIWFTFYSHRGASRLRDLERTSWKSSWP